MILHEKISHKYLTNNTAQISNILNTHEHVTFAGTQEGLCFVGLDSPRFPCHQCGRSYKYKKGLRLHLKYECNKEPQFGCSQCPYRGKQKVALIKHMFSKHGIQLNAHSTS